MSAAAELLTTLHAQGFILSADGDAIRITPASRLTLALREAIRAHKAELLAALDLQPQAAPFLDVPAESAPPPADPAALQAQLDALTADPAWASGWAERLKAARYADLDAVRRTIALLVDLAGERHRAGDAAGFRSWCRFALDHAAGRHWDEAARRPVTWPADVAIITADEAAATFADAEQAQQRLRPRRGRAVRRQR